MCVQCGKLINCEYEISGETRTAMENGLKYLTQISDTYPGEEFDSLLDKEHIDDALFMLYQSTLAKCGEDDPKFETGIMPHIPTGHMRTMIRIAYVIGWYTHEHEWSLPKV